MRGPGTIARAVIGLLCAAVAPGVAQDVAIVGGRVVPVSGDPIESATVLIREGRIAAVGSAVSIPDGMLLVDAAGRWVTPGLIHLGTRLGLVEISSVTGSTDSARAGNDVSASFNVLEGINPASELIRAARSGGVTTVLSRPTGGIVSGQAVTLDLRGETIDEMRIDSPAAMIVNLHEAATTSAGGSRAAVMATLRRLFEEARAWEGRETAFQAWQRDTEASPADLEALLAPLSGGIPTFVTANRRSDIENALRLADDFGLDLVVRSGREAWQIAARLAEAGVPVVIDPFANSPRYDGLRARLDNGALLESAGVAVVVAPEDDHTVRNLRWQAGNAVANGMSWDGALRAITLTAAEAVGLGDRYGSLDPGKVANVVVWSGDPLELSTVAERVFIRGREAPTVGRPTRLMERYLER